MLYADFQSILKPVDEVYKDKMNIMKAEKKGKAPCTEKINADVPSRWCVSPLRMECSRSIKNVPW